MAIARQTIDLYLSMSHEQASPVPVDDLVRGRVALSIRRHEPVGVVTAITPYNAALIMGFQKLIPALMAGNSVILRPSPLTPISSLIFGAAADAAGLPPGVLSVVVESGTAGAELLTSHPAVDMVSFTGSTVAGRKILAQAAPTVKRVSLELGGKSAQIYLPDAVTARGRRRGHGGDEHGGPGVRGGHPNARAAGPQAKQVLEAVSAVYKLDQGRPAHRRRRRSWDRSSAPRSATGASGYVAAGRRARRQGVLRRRAARRAWSGATTSSRPCSDLPSNANPAAQEEIFGPVIGVLGYRDLDDAVAIANDSIYGLSGQVYGADVAAAVRRGAPAAHRRGQRQHHACFRPTRPAADTSKAGWAANAARRDPRVPGGQTHVDWGAANDHHRRRSETQGISTWTG